MNRPIILSGAFIALASLALWWWLTPSANDRALSLVETRPPSATYTIVAFGDSLTAGYGLPAGEAYPAQLEAALLEAGYSVRIINAGVSGETTRGNVERASFIRSQNPDIVLLGIGGNDALRLLPIEETEKNLRQSIATLQSGESPPVVIFLRMQAPLTAGLGYKERFDALYEELAKEYGLILVPFITAELFLDSANKLPDGIHYNAQGYRKVVDQYLKDTVMAVLERMRR